VQSFFFLLDNHELRWSLSHDSNSLNAEGYWTRKPRDLTVGRFADGANLGEARRIGYVVDVDSIWASRYPDTIAFLEDLKKIKANKKELF